MGTPMELVRRFGGKDACDKSIRELEAELYRQSGKTRRSASRVEHRTSMLDAGGPSSRRRA